MADLVTPPLWLQSGSYGADDDRALLRALITVEGIAASGDLLVAANGTPNMTVNVAAGRAFVQRTGATDFYLVENDASQSLAIAASDPTNARKDIVVARVYDSTYSGALNKATLEVVTGTPNAVPVEPAVPNNAIKLAVVNVAAGASTIAGSNITDARSAASVGLDQASVRIADLEASVGGKFRFGLDGTLTAGDGTKTIAHGLGVAPSAVFVFPLNVNAAINSREQWVFLSSDAINFVVQAYRSDSETGFGGQPIPIYWLAFA